MAAKIVHRSTAVVVFPLQVLVGIDLNLTARSVRFAYPRELSPGRGSCKTRPLAPPKVEPGHQFQGQKTPKCASFDIESHRIYPILYSHDQSGIKTYIINSIRVSFGWDAYE